VTVHRFYSLSIVGFSQIADLLDNDLFFVFLIIKVLSQQQQEHIKAVIQARMMIMSSYFKVALAHIQKCK